MNIDIQSNRVFRVVLELTDDEAFDLANSIGEAASFVDNWRSNPEGMIRLRQKLCKELETKNVH